MKYSFIQTWLKKSQDQWHNGGGENFFKRPPTQFPQKNILVENANRQ